jgi:hypothetical protein
MKISKRAKRDPRVIRTLPALRLAIANLRARGRTIGTKGIFLWCAGPKAAPIA